MTYVEDPPKNKQCGPCARCGSPTAQPTLWRDARGERRDAWKARGWRRFSGRGLCASCYAVVHRGLAGERLESYARQEVGAATADEEGFRAQGRGACSRCGVGSSPAEPVALDAERECQDCSEVRLELAG